MERQRLFEIIEKSDGEDKLSVLYDVIMITVIALSLLPLAFKQESPVLMGLDRITAGIFIVDYILRWMTADYKFKKPGSRLAFCKYPFSPMAIIDLLSILPSLHIFGAGAATLRLLRMIRAMRVVRVLKVMRYSRSFAIISDVLQSSKESLIAVCALAGGYILVAALIVFNVEPDSFDNFFEAVYWATVSLTTVGYGDIYPISTAGRIITMASSIFGIAIVALPAGIITAGYMKELEKRQKEEDERERLEEIERMSRQNVQTSGAPENEPIIAEALESAMTAKVSSSSE